MFYTLEALVQAGNISPEQMVTTILEGLTTTNLAFENSGINMELELVYVGLVSGVGGSGARGPVDCGLGLYNCNSPPVRLSKSFYSVLRFDPTRRNNNRISNL